MATANEINLDHDLPPNIPTNSITSTSSSAAERGDGSGLIGTPLQTVALRRRMTPKGLLKLVGVRFMRTVRRGNLPFLILFFSCVVVFFSALTGVGYVEPPSEGLALDDPQFKLGQPVFDPKEDSITIARQRQIEALRELEMEWAQKKRPQDGQWMQKTRDHGARRLREESKALEVFNNEAYGDDTGYKAEVAAVNNDMLVPEKDAANRDLGQAPLVLEDDDSVIADAEGKAMEAEALASASEDVEEAVATGEAVL